MFDIDALLEGVRAGSISVAEAGAKLKAAPFLDLGYAKLDLHRSVRSGMSEVVFCQGKDDKFLTEIFARLLEANGEVLGTRCSAQQAQLLQGRFTDLCYDEISDIIRSPLKETLCGLIAVVTAGTADIRVAEEAAQTCEFFGGKVLRLYDAGVSGLHRLLSRAEDLQRANVVIAAAGMEGALPSVIGGLVGNPVIAVPTSVGYGANFGGLSALLTMINTCANGVCTVNIDNGFGAAFLATQINRLAVKGGQR